MARWLLFALIACCAATPAFAGHFENGDRAYSRGDYVTAFKEWTAGDAENDPESTYELSVTYREAEGVPKDLEKSAQLLLKAANQGFVPAQYNLAEYYRLGIGVRKDDVATRYWYSNAADKFSVNAMHGYATLLLQGLGGPVDKAAAAHWYERARYFGDTDPYYDRLIEKGELPKPDYLSLLKQRTTLAQAGNAEAQYELAQMYVRGEGVVREDAQAVRWFRAAADNGHSMAQFYLGTLYRDGRAGARDLKEASLWWRKAVLQGNAFAASTLGLGYFLGDGVKQDKITGLALLIVGVFDGDNDIRKTRVTAALGLTEDELTAAKALAQKCLSQGMPACLPPD